MYQNVSTPRIYLNVPEYLASIGYRDVNYPDGVGGGANLSFDVYRTLPVNPIHHPGNITSATGYPHPPSMGEVYLHNPYIAILGHNGVEFSAENFKQSIINGDNTAEGVVPGFSIKELISGSTATGMFIGGDVGSIVIGTYYDFPHSPDLNLSLSYEYDGIKEITTKGGVSLSNSFYTKPPKWGTNHNNEYLGAWELETDVKDSYTYAKSGRRVWDLSFSYLNDSSIFPDNAGLVNETATTDTTGSGEPDLTLLKDDTFQRCIHLTNGGQLPFIWKLE